MVTMTGRPDGGGALGTRSRSGDRGPGGGVGVVGWGADGGTGASGWRPRETVFTQEYIEEPDNERGQSDMISVKEELRECFGKFGEIGDVFMDGKKTSGSGSQVSMPTQANVGHGMQSSSVLRGLQWSLTDSSEIMRLVVDNPVGVQRETFEMMTARVQTDENDDAGVRPVMTALLRTSTEMPDEQAETGFLNGASLAHRLSDNECGQGELDSLEIRRSMVDRSVGVHCETVELKTLNLGRRRRTERTASPTRHTRQSWTSSLMPW